jgi:hypothetical protein
MNPVCIIGHQINKERLKDLCEHGNIKKIRYSSKASLCVEAYFMFFLPWPYYYQYQLSGLRINFVNVHFI